MKTISVAVSEIDYEYFREAAREQGRPIAQLIREAMSHYRQEKLELRERLVDLPLLPGHRALGPLPERHDLYEEMLERR